MFGWLKKGAQAGVSRSRPQAAYFNNNASPFLAGWRPALRESHEDVGQAWQDAAARAVAAIQNSGFLRGIVEVSSGSVVGQGLQMSARPDEKLLGWNAAYATEWGAKAESLLRSWGGKGLHCDAADRLTFRQQQQAVYASYLAYGEALALMPLEVRKRSRWATKMRLIPPSRLVNTISTTENLANGVFVDHYGAAVGYRLRNRKIPNVGSIPPEVDIPRYDAEGRPNVLHIFDPDIAATRGISPLASVLKVVRQVDQYADANLTSAMIQTIFAATIRTDMQGITAFEGLMTEKDQGVLDLAAYADAKAQWYDGAKLDLTQHGRIAHLFPNEHLEFTEAKTPAQQFDHFMGWMMREISKGAGVTYESATGDYRGATYSSVRMAGAVEWLTVMRRRENIVVPYCQEAYEAVIGEAIYRGELEFPGGYPAFLQQADAACRAAWTGPPRPQADDFKTARAYEVRKNMGATTLQEIAADYGLDWDDMLRQQARERDLALELKLPNPWAPKDIMQIPGGEDAALEQANPDPADDEDTTEESDSEGDD